MQTLSSKFKSGITISATTAVNGKQLFNMACPDCGCALVPSSGCAYCPCCGWSVCS